MTLDAPVLPLLVGGPTITREGRFTYEVTWVTEHRLFRAERKRSMHHKSFFTKRGARKYGAHLLEAVEVLSK